MLIDAVRWSDRGSLIDRCAVSGQLPCSGAEPRDKILNAVNTAIHCDEVFNALYFIERLWWTLKHQYIYLHAFKNGKSLRFGLAKWIQYYHLARGHSSLEDKTPDEVYFGLPCPFAEAAWCLFYFSHLRACSLSHPSGCPINWVHHRLPVILTFRFSAGCQGCQDCEKQAPKAWSWQPWQPSLRLNGERNESLREFTEKTLLYQMTQCQPFSIHFQKHILLLHQISHEPLLAFFAPNFTPVTPVLTSDRDNIA